MVYKNGCPVGPLFPSERYRKDQTTVNRDLRLSLALSPGRTPVFKLSKYFEVSGRDFLEEEDNVIAVYFRTYFSLFLSNFKTFFLSFHMLTTHEDKTRDKKTSYWYKETSIDYIVHKTDFLKTV